MKEDVTYDKGNKPGNNSNAWRTIAGRSKPGTTAGDGTTPGTTPGSVIDGGTIGSPTGSQESRSPVVKRSHHGPSERAGGRKKSGIGSQAGSSGSWELEDGTNTSPRGNGSPAGNPAGSIAGNPAGSIDGNPAGTTQEEEDQTFLEFPKEAYFADGRLKKSWTEKLMGGKVKNAKPVTTLKKKSGKSFLEDKELLGQVVEGIQVGFKGLDLLADYGLGVNGVWELDDNEAEVLARVLLRRADKGDKAALKTIQAMRDNIDLFQAAMVVIPRVGITIKEVAKNGAKPHVKKRVNEPIPADGN